MRIIVMSAFSCKRLSAMARIGAGHIEARLCHRVGTTDQIRVADALHVIGGECLMNPCS